MIDPKCLRRFRFLDKTRTKLVIEAVEDNLKAKMQLVFGVTGDGTWSVDKNIDDNCTGYVIYQRPIHPCAEHDTLDLSFVYCPYCSEKLK